MQQVLLCHATYMKETVGKRILWAINKHIQLEKACSRIRLRGADRIQIIGLVSFTHTCQSQFDQFSFKKKSNRMKATSEGEKGSKATSDNERKKGKKETGKKEKAAMFVQSFIVSLSLSSSSQSLSLSLVFFLALVSSFPFVSSRTKITRYLVDPASSHMLVTKAKPCMCKNKPQNGESANGSLKQLLFI